MATATGGYSAYPTWFYLRSECYELSTSITTNTSVVRQDTYMDFYQSGSTYTDNTIFMQINGVGTNNGTANYYSGVNGTVTYISTQDVTVTHDANGSKTVGFGASDTTNFFGSASTSGSLALTDFNYAPGTPASCAAVVTGLSAVVTSGASTSYAIAGTVSYYVQNSSSSDGGVTWGAWSTAVIMTAKQYTYTLTGGLTYRFRVYATNTAGDGNSGYKVSSNYFLSSGGKVYRSGAWVRTAVAAKRWNGTAWVDLTIAKRFDGTAWVNLT